MDMDRESINELVELVGSVRPEIVCIITATIADVVKHICAFFGNASTDDDLSVLLPQFVH